MMLIISPLLALIALVTVPVSIFVTKAIAQALAGPSSSRSGGHRPAERADRGGVHRSRAGARLRPAARSRGQRFAETNDELYQASFGAQFISGIIMPAMMFIGNLNYVVIAVVGGLRVASGSMSLGDVQAFIQYSRQFTQPLTQVASMANLLQSGVASAERVFDLLDAPEQEPDPAEPPALPELRRGRVEFEHVSFRYKPDEPLIDDLSLVAEPGQHGGHRRADRRRQDHAGQPDHAVLRARLRPDHARRRRHHRDAPRRTARRRSAWCCRTPGCSAARSGTTSPTAVPAPPTTRSSPPAEAAFVDRFVQALPDGYQTVLDEETQQRQRRAAAAAHDRARVPRRPGAADPRRGDELGRHPHRAARPARHRGAARQPHQLRRRAPAVDDPRRRPDPGHGRRPDRRAGHARRNCSPGAGRTTSCTTRSSPRRATQDDPVPVGRTRLTRAATLLAWVTRCATRGPTS